MPRPHVDGSWDGPVPEHADMVDAAGRPTDPARWFGPAEDKRGLNDGQLWMDRNQTMSVGGSVLTSTWA